MVVGREVATDAKTALYRMATSCSHIDGVPGRSWCWDMPCVIRVGFALNRPRNLLYARRVLERSIGIHHFEYGVYHGMVSVESALADALLH